MLRPLGDRVLVKPILEDKTSIGIIVDVGDGSYQNGTFIPTRVSKDLKIMYLNNILCDSMIDNVKHVIIRESDILAVVIQ